jgi:hypothetical protein
MIISVKSTLTVGGNVGSSFAKSSIHLKSLFTFHLEGWRQALGLFRTDYALAFTAWAFDHVDLFHNQLAEGCA